MVDENFDSQVSTRIFFQNYMELRRVVRRLSQDELKNSEEYHRLLRMEQIIRKSDLTVERIVEVLDYDLFPSFLVNERIISSCVYTELNEEHEQLELKHGRLEERYRGLVKRLEKLFGSQFELKDFLDKQREEARGEE